MNSIITNPPATQEGIGIQTAVLTADFPKTNNTLAAVTGWSNTITLEAGKTYRVTGQFVGIDGSGDDALRADFAGGTATITGMNGVAIVGAGGAVQVSALTDLFIANAGETLAGSIDFTLQCDAAGTLNMRCGQLLTNVLPSTLLKYSTISAQEISPTPTY